MHSLFPAAPAGFVGPFPACVLMNHLVTGPAAVSPLDDKRCRLQGLKGKLKGDVSQRFQRLDPEGPWQSQPGLASEVSSVSV